MNYYHNTTVTGHFDQVIEIIIGLLKNEGFGILCEIDVQQTLKDKLDVDFKKYKILGACHPGFAYEALSVEDKIGTLLPCNIIVQELGPKQIEVAAVNPLVSMEAVRNSGLNAIAQEVNSKLQTLINSLKNEV